MKILLVRGAKGIGDLLWTTPIPRLLSQEGHKVDVVAWPENQAVFLHNPYVRKIVKPPPPNCEEEFAQWFDTINASYDRILNLGFLVEKALLHRTDGYFGPIPPLEERRAAAQGKNYMRLHLEAAGFSNHAAVPELYPSSKEEAEINRLQQEKEEHGWQVVFWHLNGSTLNKNLIQGHEWIKAVSAACSRSLHFIVGSVPVKPPSLTQDTRVYDFSGAWSLRTAMLMTKIADVVVGPESAIINAAAAWPNCKKVTIYSHSSPENLGGDWENHHAILPDCPCSPCYLIPVNFRQVYDPERRRLAREQEGRCLRRHPVNPFVYEGYHCVLGLDSEQITDTIIHCLQKGG